MNKLSLILSLLVFQYNVFAQSEQAGSAMKSPVEVKFLGFGIPESDDIELQPQLTHVVSRNESENQEELEQIKKDKMLLKRAAMSLESADDEPQDKKTRGFEPIVEAVYSGPANSGTPSDNTIAVNKSGQLITMVNSSMRTYNSTNGTGIGSIKSLPSFFNTFSNGSLLSNNTCDPKVIFDAQADRFVVFAQTCDGQSSTSQLLLAFSKTADPADGWYFYTFTGNPSSSIGTNVWFDYPKIGYSNHDIFVTGNLFDNNFNYVQSVIYQIDKTKCYAGSTLGNNDASIWYNLPNSPFTIVPISNGQNGGYGNNIYLVSTKQGFSGTSLSVYEITNAVQNNPNLVDNYVGIPNAGTPANAVQMGSSIELNTGDSRGMDGFYLNGMIHYVFHFDAGGGYTGINYSRLTKSGSNWALNSNKIIKTTNVDCAFPSIVSFGDNTNDQAALIGYLYSSNAHYPGMRVVYVDNGGTASNPVDVKVGTSYVNYLAQSGETRWGDYSGLSRLQNATKPTAWMFGMVGNANHSWNNHFAKITSSAWTTGVEDVKETQSTVQVFPNPLVNDIYSIAIELEQSGNLEIKLLDMNGAFVRKVLSTPATKGKNLFSFNKGVLATGNYFLNFTLDNKVIKNEKITVISK